MELRHYLTVGRRWWWFVLLAGLIAGGLAYYIASSRPPVYRATTTFFVNQTSQLGSLTYSDAMLSQALVKTYAQMVTQPVVLSAAVDRLRIPGGVDQVSRMVSARAIRETQLFELSAESNDPAQARDLANVIAQVFIEQQRASMVVRESEEPAPDSLRVAQEALLPTEPVGARLSVTVALWVLVGLVLAAAIALLLEYLDDTVKTPEDLDRAAALPTLGAVFRMKPSEGPVAPLMNSRSASAEAFRMVRANLEFAAVDAPISTLLVTSAGPAEGKTTTAANLAHTLAQGGKRVILADADLRRPGVHRLYTLPNRCGLSTLLLQENPELDGMLQETATPNLWILPSGPIPPNPAELLASPRLDAVLDKLKEVADVVIVDSPPVLVTVDPVVVASRVDGTVLVIDSAKTRSDPVRRAVEALSKSGTRVLGGVLNKLNQRAAGGYYYAHYRYQDGQA